MKIVPTLPRGNASRDALRHRCAGLKSGRGASLAAFLCCAWERSLPPHPAPTFEPVTTRRSSP
ncbi:DUF1534 domain-containing protein [Pseudomonas sp. PA-6-1D]|nr:DUF1534 domain-containing protein [Pseudomonas sp. PA-6-3C]MCF5149953.1 DUF1534 domain-containing protein [Pseudomonas sp. PA-6-3F]MCF5158122.1 DUF1534 domain-containing protein [Pseudomonas sp. PA-6-2E]MCF5176250.1 DUF1534 domain-containing protein [Pseudomonas sp. PA-6-1D]MCF5193931.1 DUF1534 domain-containing protein [Pseudomonas sp. PA-6-1H]MCF8974508.1 DUF1534 domain-containing protein [Pseudomonas edaphica]